MNNGADRKLSPQKVRDRSMALLLIGIGALLPPVVGVALIDSQIAGIPIPLLYIFVVWALLIAGARALARPLLDADNTRPRRSGRQT